MFFQIQQIDEKGREKVNDQSKVGEMFEQAQKFEAGDYVRTINGLYVAWSLFSPPNDFGDWSLISLRNELICGQVVCVPTFRQALDIEDIEYVSARLNLFRGIKLEGTQWALVKAVVKSEATVSPRPVHQVEIDPLHRTAV